MPKRHQNPLNSKRSGATFKFYYTYNIIILITFNAQSSVKLYNGNIQYTCTRQFVKIHRPHQSGSLFIILHTLLLQNVIIRNISYLGNEIQDYRGLKWHTGKTQHSLSLRTSTTSNL